MSRIASVYSIKGAAAYTGRHEQTLKYHLYGRGGRASADGKPVHGGKLLKPDLVIDGKPMFHKSTLDAYLKEVRRKRKRHSSATRSGAVEAA